MRRLWLILLCWLPFAAHSAASKAPSLSRLGKISIQGRDYIRLDEWARAIELDYHAPKKGEEVRISSAWATLKFAIDAPTAEINGVRAWLSYPVAPHNGVACITRLDLEKLVHPLLFPAHNPAKAKINRICIDPGHGGKDPGNLRGPDQEKTYALELAQELSRQLTAAGFKVSLTRTRDEFVDLPHRPEIARRERADLFLSLHFNAVAGAPEVKGAEIYCLPPARAPSTNARGEGANTGPVDANRYDERNVLLGFELQKSLIKSLGVEDRGLHRARFAVLHYAPAPAVLIEGGFISNAEEAKRIFNPAWRKQLAEAIVDGVMAYKRMVER